MSFKDFIKNTKLYVSKNYNNPKNIMNDVNIIVKNSNIIDNTKNKIDNVIQNQNVIDTKNKLNDIIQNSNIVINDAKNKINDAYHNSNIIEDTIKNTNIVSTITTTPYTYFKTSIYKSQYGVFILCCKIFLFGIFIVICAKLCKKYVTKDLDTFNNYFEKFGQGFMSLSLLGMLLLGFIRIII